MTDLVTKTRCNGQCCKDFIVNRYSRSEFERVTFDAIDAAARLREELEAGIYPEGSYERNVERLEKADAYAHETATILSMIRPVVGESPSFEGKWRTEADHHFTCVHFDNDSGNCGIYEDRPKICREYPYGVKCEHGDKCTWKEAEVASKLMKQRDAPDYAALLRGSSSCSNDLITIGGTSLRRKRAIGVRAEANDPRAPIVIEGKEVPE